MQHTHIAVCHCAVCSARLHIRDQQWCGLQQEPHDCTSLDQQTCHLQQEPQAEGPPAENGTPHADGGAAEDSGPAAGQADGTQPPPAKRIRIKLGSRGASSLPGSPQCWALFSSKPLPQCLRLPTASLMWSACPLLTCPPVAGKTAHASGVKVGATRMMSTAWRKLLGSAVRH